MDVSLDEWIRQAKDEVDFDECGMILCHNGVVRGRSRDGRQVAGMKLTCDRSLIPHILDRIESKPGIVKTRVWVNEGDLKVGDDIMYALVAGDIRDRVISALQELVALVKSEVVDEIEDYV